MKSFVQNYYYEVKTILRSKYVQNYYYEVKTILRNKYIMNFIKNKFQKNTK
jgi:hypothetical protein